MFNLDAEKMAKNVLQGVKKAEKLADLPGGAAEQAAALLRRLLAEAKASPLAGKNAALDACIQKVEKLGGDIPADAAAKLTAELTALLKGTGTSGQAAGGAPQKANAPSGAGAAGKAPAAPVKRTEQAAREPSAAVSKAVQFSDVETGAYYYDAVQWAVQKGIASGTTETTFSPDQNCTRAQTVTLLWRAAGAPAPKSQNNPFTDVKDSAYYGDAVLWAAERGIVSGTEFHPDDAVTRGQLAAFLYRNAGSPTAAADSTFTDVPGDAYYAQAVAWVAAQGITSGTGEHTFSPDAVCTRGQIVTFLYRARKA